MYEVIATAVKRTGGTGRILIAGAGALGSAYGGLLAAAGCDVTLLARGAHAEALRRNGLMLLLPEGARRIEVTVVDEDEPDVVLLTSKAFDTPAVLERVHGAPRLAVSFQNGPGKNESLERRFGAAATAGAASTLPAELVEPGVVRAAGLGVTYLAARTPAQAEAVDELAAALRGAGLTVHSTDDADAMEWSKLAQVAATMGVQAVSRAYLHEVFGSPDGAVLVRRIVADVGALARAGGSDLVDLPGTLPARTLADGSDEEAVALLAERGRQLEKAGAVRSRTSLLQSIEAGRRTELEEIHGELVRRAAQVDVAVPTLEATYRLARLGTKREAPPGA